MFKNKIRHAPDGAGTRNRLTPRRSALGATFVATLALLVGFGAYGGVAFADVVDQCNGIALGGGQGIECTVNVVNNLDNTVPSAPVTSSTVTKTVCTGAAGAIASGSCLPVVTTNSPNLVTSVTQCNGATNGGGSQLICNVTIVNNITGTATVVPVTINQCNGSLTTGDVLSCTPDPATSGGAASADPATATVVECNGSANGGGSVLNCDVAPTSTTSDALPVRINQCNGSSNGGGSTVTCSVSLTTRVIPAVRTGGPGTGGSTTSSRFRSAGQPDTLASTGVDALPTIQLALLMLFIGAGATVWSARRAKVAKGIVV